MGKRFKQRLCFQRNSSGFIDPMVQRIQNTGDLDGDGYFANEKFIKVHDINYDVVNIIEFALTKTDVINQNDANPNDPYSNSNDMKR